MARMIYHLWIIIVRKSRYEWKLAKGDVPLIQKKISDKIICFKKKPTLF